jgi:hypothetical protein
MPYMAARVADVEGPLFLRTFGVPFWALARVFGRDSMYWYRLTCGLGRPSVAGATIRRAEIPIHLLADEHHQTIDGEKVYVATTVGDGCVLGVEPATSAGATELTAAYGVFKAEARDVEPSYAPRTVSVDGWASTHQAWLALFPLVVLLRCFLHGWLNIRSRGKLSESFRELSKRVWERITPHPAGASRNDSGGSASGPDGRGCRRGCGSRSRSFAAGRRSTPRRTRIPAGIVRATCSTG